MSKSAISGILLLTLSATQPACHNPATPRAVEEGGPATPEATGTYVLTDVAGYGMPYPAKPGGSAGRTDLIADTVTIASDSSFYQRRVYISSHPMMEQDIVERVEIDGTYTAAPGTPSGLNVRLIYPDRATHWDSPFGSVRSRITSDGLLLYWPSIFSAGSVSEWSYQKI